MCDAHEAAGVSCTPSMESIGAAIIGVVKAGPGVAFGVAAAVAVSFVVANLVWFGVAVAATAVMVAVVLVRRTARNLRAVTWQPSMATTPVRVNGVRRPAVEAPAARPALPAADYRQLAELGAAIRDVRDSRPAPRVIQGAVISEER